MQFTYQAYTELLDLLRQKQYHFCSYHDHQVNTRCIIMRHDIDQSIDAAIRLGKVEATSGIHSTYFVLLTSDFYNPAAPRSLMGLKELQAMGHEIGLHFDEKAYEPTTSAHTVENILHERDILASILGTSVTTVSMHRPSKTTLEADLKIPGMINSYSKTFFNDFKYLSDSRCHWREPVLNIIRTGEYDRLHILTHPFWYHSMEQTIAETVSIFVNNGNKARYTAMQENIADMSSIMQESEVR